jgi:hypothetical protein
MKKDCGEDTFNTCDCSDSKVCDQHHGKKATGNFKSIKSGKQCSLFCKRPTYREPKNANRENFLHFEFCNDISILIKLLITMGLIYVN